MKSDADVWGFVATTLALKNSSIFLGNLDRYGMFKILRQAFHFGLRVRLEMD
jgi:hypothetical protein